MDITIYTNNSSTSSRKAVKWFSEHMIPYFEIKINHVGITREQLKEILILTDNGLDDVLKRTIKHSDLNEKNLNSVLDMIVENPNMLRVPIIISGSKMYIGYQEEHIKRFVPNSHRSNNFF